MTKQEHIQYWMTLADHDWDACQFLFADGHYQHSLFMASVVLERLIKGLWVQSHGGRMPPKISEHSRSAQATNVKFSEEELAYFQEVNRFAIEVLCPDPEKPYPWKFTREFAEMNLDRIERIAKEIMRKLRS